MYERINNISKYCVCKSEASCGCKDNCPTNCTCKNYCTCNCKAHCPTYCPCNTQCSCKSYCPSHCPCNTQCSCKGQCSCHSHKPSYNNVWIASLRRGAYHYLYNRRKAYFTDTSPIFHNKKLRGTITKININYYINTTDPAWCDRVIASNGYITINTSYNPDQRLYMTGKETYHDAYRARNTSVYSHTLYKSAMFEGLCVEYTGGQFIPPFELYTVDPGLTNGIKLYYYAEVYGNVTIIG